MLSFYQQFAEWLQQEPVVLAIVTQVKGSVPREVGARMAIRADGQTLGTIGGGAGEAKVIRHAMQILATGEKQQVEIDLTGAPQRETQGICGGTMQVWLERWQGDAAFSLVQSIITLLQSGQAATLVTPFTQNQSPHLQFTNTELPPSSLIPAPSSFIDLLLPAPTLLIVGAGHCAIPLASVAHLAGFRVVVQDDRPEFACAERFPNASVVEIQPIAEVVESLAKVADLYVALVTRGYLHDLAALKVLLPRSLHYIGMIGSEKRVRIVYQALQQAGFTAQQLQKIHAPIGLDIGALTPEEIAISIGAELIKIRRGGTGVSLSQRMRQSMESW
jgi:xanthine dehydrogenase accessory factor